MSDDLRQFERIYLTYCDGSYEQPVLWCTDRVDDDDVAYVNAAAFGSYCSYHLIVFYRVPGCSSGGQSGDFVGPRLAPAGLGFITLFFGIGQALGPAIGGYLADVSQSFTIPFLVAGGISLVGMVFSLYLKKPTAL